MAHYQIEAREYTCPSCLMNYGVKADSYEDAALQIYTKYYDPAGSHLSAISWDGRSKTLNTDLGVYLEVSENSLNNEPAPGLIIDSSMWHSLEDDKEFSSAADEALIKNSELYDHLKHKSEEEVSDESEEFTEDVWLG